MSKAGGYIYAIGAEGTSFVKIGSTKGAVEKRLAQLQTGQPLRLFVITSLAVDGDVHFIERYIHNHLSECRGKGEWFETFMDADILSTMVKQGLVSLEDSLEDVSSSAANRYPSLLVERIVALRTQRGWTRRKLAEFADLHEQHLAKIERGGRTRLEPDTLVKLASTLGVSVDYLVGLTDDPRPRKRAQTKKTDNVSEYEPAMLA